MKDGKLTPGEERFALEYVKNGGNASEAYRVAFPGAAKKWKQKTIWSRASEMFNSSEVSGRIEELRKEVRDESIADAAERRRFWSNVLRGQEAADMKDRLKASELLGKSDGDFVDRKRIEGEISVVGKIEINVVRPNT